MANLQFVDFALMLNPARNVEHFRLPDYFPNIDITIILYILRFSRQKSMK